MSATGQIGLSELKAIAQEFLRRDGRSVDLKEYRALIDALEGDFASVAREEQRSGAYRAEGTITAVSWISRTCSMSVTSAAEPLCVSYLLDGLAGVAKALSSGEIGYQ